MERADIEGWGLYLQRSGFLMLNPRIELTSQVTDLPSPAQELRQSRKCALDQKVGSLEEEEKQGLASPVSLLNPSIWWLLWPPWAEGQEKNHSGNHLHMAGNIRHRSRRFPPPNYIYG